MTARAADDFDTIRARLAELEAERRRDCPAVALFAPSGIVFGRAVTPREILTIEGLRVDRLADPVTNGE